MKQITFLQSFVKTKSIKQHQAEGVHWLKDAPHERTKENMFIWPLDKENILDSSLDDCLFFRVNQANWAVENQSFLSPKIAILR